LKQTSGNCRVSGHVGAFRCKRGNLALHTLSSLLSAHAEKTLGNFKKVFAADLAARRLP
jgi:hypothetical protein